MTEDRLPNDQLINLDSAQKLTEKVQADLNLYSNPKEDADAVDQVYFSRGLANIAEVLHVFSGNTKFGDFYFNLTQDELFEFLNLVAKLSAIINHIPANEKLKTQILMKLCKPNLDTN